MTKFCRFDDDRLGLVEGDTVIDVTQALDVLPSVRWPLPQEDMLIANIDKVLEAAKALRGAGKVYPVDTVRFLSPVANVAKVIAAPVNYLKHQAEANADGGKNFDKDVKTIAHYGLFLKSSTSVVGIGEGIEIVYPDRRTDHEIELVVVIGKGGRNIRLEDALDHVAGYTLGLDITLRGPEDRSLRKSLDSFSVLGPWITTPDEIDDPNNLALSLSVNGEPRQDATTADLIFNVQQLIEYASAHYALCPGDVIYTGTPEGVGPIVPGDVVDFMVEKVGAARMHVTGPRQ